MRCLSVTDGYPRIRGLILLCVLLVGSSVLAQGLRVAAAAEPTKYHQGKLAGADYIISLPAAWNGGLVVFAHGYQGEGGAGTGSVWDEPLAGHLEERGYAWAASSYRSRGYRPDWFVDDLLVLRRSFIGQFGTPRWTIIHGQSMGGHVTIASLELHPEIYQGGLIECGIIDGVGLVDWLHAYTAAAQYFTQLPLLDTPRPEFDVLAIVSVPKLLGSPGEYTELGRRFDSVVKHLMGGDIPLRLEAMKTRYLANLNPRDPGPARAQEFARHSDTRHILYQIDPEFGLDEAALNRDMPRVIPAPGARSREANPAFAQLTGNIKVPVMAIHETGDFRVPFRLQQDYRRRTMRAGTADLLVQRPIRRVGHCGFDNAIRARAFDDLVAWIEGGPTPAGDDVLGDPTQLGLRWTPQRHPNDPLSSNYFRPK